LACSTKASGSTSGRTFSPLSSGPLRARKSKHVAGDRALLHRH
jgi:hypothetical protein